MPLLRFAIIITAIGGSVRGEERTAPELTPAQRRSVKRWLGEFRRARKSPARRTAAAKQLVAIGEPAAKQLLKVVNDELAPKLSRYETAIAKRAAELARARLSKADVARIQSLRSRVLALRKRGDLSKALIAREADPALAELRKLLILDPKLVLAKAPRKLVEDREELLALGRHWELCAKTLAKKPATGKRGADASFEKSLRQRERTASQALTIDARTRTVLAANARLAGQIDAEEANCIRACNSTRVLLGLPPLAIDLKLAAAARDHSRDMQRLRFFSHTSPVPGKRSFGVRARRFGTTAAAENIFQGVRNGTQVHTGWFHSPGHHRNMLGAHTRIGVGRAGKYYTQLFGR